MSKLKVRVKFHDAATVNNFVSIISKIDGDFDLGSGRYLVDAKSIMGVFSLDLSKPHELTINAENPEEIASMLASFIV